MEQDHETAVSMGSIGLGSIHVDHIGTEDFVMQQLNDTLQFVTEDLVLPM
jgi:hypothetical protein